MSLRLPETMTVVEIAGAGGPDVLQIGTRPLPRPGEGEVLVRVAAAGVNYPDVMQREGRYQPPPGVTDIPGLEVAGTILESGKGAENLPSGTDVCALVAGGGYAEYCTVPAPQVLPLPSGMDMAGAAAIPETFFTAWTNLYDSGRLMPGETVLIHGGSGGIGTTVIQMASCLGSTVFATARNSEKCRACIGLGAARAINYIEEDFVEAVRSETDDKGCDLVIDMVGGDYVRRNLDALAPGGRLVQIAVQKGPKAELFLPTIMAKQLVVTGSLLRPRTIEQKGRIAAKLRENIWPLIERGDIAPLVHKVFPLKDADRAHTLMESSEHIGKIVLQVGEYTGRQA